MKLYMNLVAMNLKSQMQYRVSFLLTTLGQFITAFTSFFGLYFIFSRVNAIDDFNYNQVFLCFAVVMMAFAIGEMFGGGLAVFPRIMGNGEFDRALVRPRNIILQILVPNMDFTRLGLLIQAVIVLCYAVPGSGILWDWKKNRNPLSHDTLRKHIIFQPFSSEGHIYFFYNSESQFYEYIHLWGA